MRVRFSLPAPKLETAIAGSVPTDRAAEECPINYCSNCGKRTHREIPADDSRTRDVCTECGTIHYQNPKIVVGCLAVHGGQILLCRRAIEPRRGYWTLPAGFMELGETMAQGAQRETREEACAEVEIERLYASVDVVPAGQVHVFYLAHFDGTFGVGVESLDSALFAPEDIPWGELAFPSGEFALRCYVGDRGRGSALHTHSALRMKRGKIMPGQTKG